jgi:hypothetical protein
MALGLFSVKADAAPVLIDFETLSDLEDVTNQFAANGILFTGATALLSGSVGGSLNDVDFPPASGFAAVFNSGDLRIDFATGASSVSGLFTYNDGLTLTAYSGATVLGSVNSAFTSNYAGSGNPNNELLSLAFSDVITHVILSAPIGSFTLDDLTVNTIDGTEPIPEPATATLFLMGAGAAWVVRRRRVHL